MLNIRDRVKFYETMTQMVHRSEINSAVFVLWYERHFNCQWTYCFAPRYLYVSLKNRVLSQNG